jgi:hypothetical protein
MPPAGHRNTPAAGCRFNSPTTSTRRRSPWPSGGRPRSSEWPDRRSSNWSLQPGARMRTVPRAHLYALAEGPVVRAAGERRIRRSLETASIPDAIRRRDLADCRGRLHLHGVAWLSDEAAAACGGRTGHLCLPGVVRLPPRQATVLASQAGPRGLAGLSYLFIDTVRHISPAVAMLRATPSVELPPRLATSTDSRASIDPERNRAAPGPDLRPV